MSIDLIEPGKTVSVRSVPPFDTGRVQIGLLYIPRYRWEPDSDDVLLQSALLTRGPRPVLRVRVGWMLSRVVVSSPVMLVWLLVGFLFLVVLGMGVAR